MNGKASIMWLLALETKATQSPAHSRIDRPGLITLGKTALLQILRLNGLGTSVKVNLKFSVLILVDVAKSVIQYSLIQSSVGLLRYTIKEKSCYLFIAIVGERDTLWKQYWGIQWTTSLASFILWNR